MVLDGLCRSGADADPWDAGVDPALVVTVNLSDAPCTLDGRRDI